MSTKQKLIEQAGFAASPEIDRLNRLIDLTVAECINAVTNSSLAHCYTTFDKDRRDATVACCIHSIKQNLQ